MLGSDAVGAGQVGLGAIVGHFHARLPRLVVGVWNGQGQIEEESFLLMLVDELQGLGGKQIVRIGDPFGRHARQLGRLAPRGRNDFIGERRLFFVAPEERRVVVVGMTLIEIAKEVVSVAESSLAARQSCIVGSHFGASCDGL